MSAAEETKPSHRTPEEIISKYRKTANALSAATCARDKLVERHEKLEKITKETEELESHSEEFANLANKLEKKMKKQKWWQL